MKQQREPVGFMGQDVLCVAAAAWPVWKHRTEPECGVCALAGSVFCFARAQTRAGVDVDNTVGIFAKVFPYAR